MNINNLYKLEKKDISKSAEMLVESFYDYPMFRYILGEKHNNNNIKSILTFLIKYAVLYGNAYATSQKIEGIILFINYKDYKFNLLRSLRCGVISLIRIGGVDVGKRFKNYDEFTKKIHNKCIKDPHQYVILVGVDPKKQGQGFGTKLMQAIFKVAEGKNQPIYLETHGDKNVAIYKKYGFKIVSKDIVPDTNIFQYAMLK